MTAGATMAALSPFRAVQSHSNENPLALTSYGPVRGVRQNGINTFKGIRYGADTTARRFERPKSPSPWENTLDTFDYGPACPQRGSNEAQSEDCLCLNVWTPAIADGGKRPVMVYFHGGAYAAGSGSDPLYDGSNLVSEGDVVVITVNHRLNAFGHLFLPMLTGGAFPDSGNVGIWDLVLALEWVRDNALAFGGDPTRVMVFGQSGGGAKIATMMAAPAAKHLFHAAATMSGQQVTASGPLNATARARAFLDAVGIAAADSELLKTMPTDKLIEGLSAKDPVNRERNLYFGPVLDERLLMRHPFWPDAPAQSASLPMILGNTKDETRNLIGNRDASAFSLEWGDLPVRLASELRVDISPAEVVQRYREIYPEYSPSDVFFAATTAARSWRGQVEEADARARQGAPTWVYQMDLPSPKDGGKWGAPHTFDIPLAFNNISKEGSLTGTSDAAQRVARQLSDAFISLARNGDPNHPGLPSWGRYELPDRATMVFAAKAHLSNDPRKAERELFSKVPFTQWGT